MGWRGTVRTLGAISRQAERDSLKRSRERAKNLVAMEKLEAKEQAAEAVRENDAYLNRLVTIHTKCSDQINWKSRAAIPSPIKPVYKSELEDGAKKKLDSYRPSWFTKLLGNTEKQRRELSTLIQKGKQDDQKIFSEKSSKYLEELAEHIDETTFAKRVVALDSAAHIEAIKVFEPLAAIGLLGEHMKIEIFAPGKISVELNVHGEEIIPKDRPKLLASGRASVKPMPKGEYYRLYQDHVCSAGLRVARELLALLPIEEVLVTAVDNLLDPATGHLKESAILSFRAPRKTMEQINFDAIDPSDSMKNFLHHMNFGTTTGFKPVNPLTF